MDPLDLRDELRKYLQSEHISLEDIVRSTTLSRSWLSQFRRGLIDNPTVQQLNALHRYRESTKAKSDRSSPEAAADGSV